MRRALFIACLASFGALSGCLDDLQDNGDTSSGAASSATPQSSAAAPTAAAPAAGSSNSAATNTTTPSTTPAAPTTPPPAPTAGTPVVMLAGKGTPIPIGWSQLANSKLEAVCPPAGFGGEDYDFRFKCRAVTDAWNSAVMDTKRNRLIVWGGGHADHLGNEIYAANLTEYSIQRVTDPGLPLTRTGCHTSVAGGTQANSRHTYDGIAYVENVDKMFVIGGSVSQGGCLTNDTWLFDFGTNRWEPRAPSGTLPRGNSGIVSAYDPNTGKVFVHDNWHFYAYDVQANRYDRVAADNNIDNHMTAVIDPLRRQFVILGFNRAYSYNIAANGNYLRETLITSGGGPIVGAPSPGLAYDPVSKKIVGWHGGSTVYTLDLDTKVWTALSFPQGPGAAQGNGTFKRFNYSKALDAFVLVNSMTENVYLLRLPRN